MMTQWMEDNMRDVLAFMLNADKSDGVANLLRCIPNGFRSAVMLSVNLRTTMSMTVQYLLGFG